MLVQLHHLPCPLFQVVQPHLQPAPSAAQLSSLFQPPSLPYATADRGGGGETGGQSDPPLQYQHYSTLFIFTLLSTFEQLL